MKLEEIGKTALSKDAPDPKQVQYESPEFEKLTQEIGKLSSLHGETVEWRDVIETSTVIIRDKSKDLEVVTYLCRGLWERDGYAGLRVGFTILRDIIQEYWDIAYPPKKKARMRGGKISWLVDRLGKILPDHEPQSEEKDTISTCLELIKEIETILNDKLGDNAPVLRELREPFETFNKNFIYLEKEAEAQKPKEVVKPAEISSPSVASANGNDIKKAFKSCHNTVYQIAKVKRAEKLSDPLPYRILRVSAWMSIEKMPFLQNGKFVVPGPPQNQILQLLEQAEYVTLIDTVENMFANPDVQPANAYWLDAHRFTVTALDALGSEYQNAKQTVIEELATFLRRFPKLPELHFNDDTPFADAQTKVWITEQVLTTESEPEPERGGGEEEVKTLKEAKQLASKGQFAEGLSLLQNGVQSAKNQREKFVCLLEQARFCYDMDHVDLAKPMLEFLEEQVARFNLEEWEPMLSVEVARLLLMCKDTNKQLYARLCRLDVTSALTLEKRK